jgi:hypothetical protein
VSAGNDNNPNNSNNNIGFRLVAHVLHPLAGNALGHSAKTTSPDAGRGSVKRHDLFLAGRDAGHIQKNPAACGNVG